MLHPAAPLGVENPRPAWLHPSNGAHIATIQIVPLPLLRRLVLRCPNRHSSRNSTIQFLSVLLSSQLITPQQPEICLAPNPAPEPQRLTKREKRTLRAPVPFCHLRLFFSRKGKSRKTISPGSSP